MSAVRIERLGQDNVRDFYRLHSDACGAVACFCVAWWVESFDGWGDRTTDENRALREDLLAHGESDGYLLYDDERPAAWCQVAPRDRLPGLARFGLEPDPGAWAIGCLLVAPDARRRGHARALIEFALTDLPGRGATSVEAFPKRGPELPADELWNGPEHVFRALGFEVAVEDDVRPVLRRALA